MLAGIFLQGEKRLVLCVLPINPGHSLLDHGRVLQYGTPEELYQAPCNETVARFVGLSTILPATVCATDEIDLGFARLRCDTGARAIGSAVKMLVRPESIDTDPPAGTVNRLPGRVTLKRYLGALTRYDFQVDGCDTVWLGDARHVPEHAIAVVPEHVRLLDN